MKLEGKAQKSVVISVATLIADVVIDFFLIYGIAGVPRLGASGVFPAGGDSRYDAISVFFASWCFALPLALVGTFIFHWPVIAVYILMSADEIVKLPWLYPRYKKYLWLNNLTRENPAGEEKA